MLNKVWNELYLFLAMQWSAIIFLLIIIITCVTVKSVLAFTFCAIVSFIFARNLLDSDIELDFTGVFVYQGQSPGKQRNTSNVVKKSLPQALAGSREPAVRNILRDFVVSWFQNVGVEERFVVETRTLLEEATENLYEEIARTDISSYVEKLCFVLHKHLAAFRVAKLSLVKNHEKFKNDEINLEEVYKSLEERPHAYRNNGLQYLRTVVDLLLYRLVKKKALDCDIGRFILREILAVNLLLPLVDSLSDSDFLNTSIINVFGNERQESQRRTLREGNNYSESMVKHSSTLMKWCGEMKGDSSSDNDIGFVKDSASAKPSTKYKVEAVVEQGQEGFVEIFTDQSLNSEKTVRVAPVQNTKQDCASNHPETMSKANFQVTVESDEICNAFNGEPTNSLTLTSNTNKILERDKLKNENGKVPEGKENGLKLKALLGAKIHPSGFIFSRSFKHFNTSPTNKHSVFKKMGQSLQETFSSKGSSKVEENSDQSDLPISDGSLDDVDIAHSSFLSKGNEEVNQTEMHKNLSIKKPIQDPANPVLDTAETGSTSSFEEVDIFNVSDCNKEDLTITESKNKGIESNGPLTSITTKNKTDNTFKPEETLILCEEDGRGITSKVNNFLEKETSQSSSSTSEEWDVDVFGQEEDNRFKEIGGDISDVETGREVFSSFGDSDTRVLQNPCSMISIPSTELLTDHTWDPGKRKFTVYQIVYDIQLWPQLKDNELSSKTTLLNADKSTERSIKRRYREFMELHHRLSSGPCASYLKDIPKPNRKFGSPFFRLDQDVVEGRQILLENYLKCLVDKPVILNCDIFKGFLGIGHPSHTKFYRQIAVPVPRIDKMLQKNVNKFIDHIKTIKTALESGPIDGDKEEEYEDIRLVLGEEKTSQDEIRTFAHCSGDCKLTHSCCYAGKCFQSYLLQKHQDSDNEGLTTEQEGNESQGVRLNVKHELTPALELDKKLTKHPITNTKDPKRKRTLTTEPADDCSSKPGYCEDDHTAYPISEAVLNLSCEVLQDQKSWVCLEPVQKAATAFFGGVIEWWLKSLVMELVTVEQWHYYLNLLTETIWPGGQLMKSRTLEKTEEEKEKNRVKAAETLSNSFGGFLHAGIGTDAINSLSSDIVESLQFKEVNRQLLLEVLEVTLTEVFPDIINDQELYLSTRNC